MGKKWELPQNGSFWSNTPSSIFSVSNIILSFALYHCFSQCFSVKDNIDAFAKASSRHQEALKRHLQDFADDAESDEEDVADKVIENIFKSYSTNYGNFYFL